MTFTKTRISVFGGRDINENMYYKTQKLGELLANEGYLVYCGGGKGVMEAIAKGVHNKKGICIGILKGDSLSEMNNYINIPVSTNMGISRNALLAYNCDVAVAISGKYGTLSEISYAFQLGKPVIGLNSWNITGLKNVSKPHQIIDFIKENL
tara:strand:- start:37 stop:492 length:456 start_codon:yes stop_codon:yes gene_type:complete